MAGGSPKNVQEANFVPAFLLSSMVATAALHFH